MQQMTSPPPTVPPSASCTASTSCPAALRMTTRAPRGSNPSSSSGDERGRLGRRGAAVPQPGEGRIGIELLALDVQLAVTEVPDGELYLAAGVGIDAGRRERTDLLLGASAGRARERRQARD